MRARLGSERLDRHDDLTASYVRTDEDEAERLALDHYDVVGIATRLETEKDDTFRLDCTDGRQVILKVANPAERVLAIDLQVSVMEYVAGHRTASPKRDPRPWWQPIGADR